MDLQEILAAILNPGGLSQQNHLATAGLPIAAPRVGDHADPASLQQSIARFSGPQGIFQQPAPLLHAQNMALQSSAAVPASAPRFAAPPQARSSLTSSEPVVTGSPWQSSEPASGSGIGDFLSDLIAPQRRQKNITMQWLQAQGLDQGTATVLASDKPALRSYLLQRSKGGGLTEFDQRAAAAQQFGLDLTSKDGRNFILTGKLPDEKQREIRNDANGVPRYVDNGAAVYPSDQSASAGTQFFSGRSVEAQGLNYLIERGVLTKDQAANVAAGKTVTGPNGEIIFMTPQGIFQQPAGGGAAQPVGGPQPAQQGGNIPITGPKYSEDMRKAGGFAMRADEADRTVSQPNITAAGASMGQHARAAAPFGLGNYLVSDDYQKFDQAQRDFINAVLRRESGAAISESEFQNARQQYFPQPGDGPDVIQQKARNRQLAVQSLRESADPVPSLNGSPKAPSSGEGWTDMGNGVKIRRKQ